MRATRVKRVIGVVVGVIVVSVLLLLLPPVQTGLVRALAGRIEGVEVALDRFWAGPWGADVRGFRIAIPGIEIEVPHAKADLAFWSSLGHLGIDLEDLSVAGVRVTVGRRGEREQATVSEPAEFRGLGPLLRLPRRVVVRRAAADGTVEVAASPEVRIEGQWSLAADDIGAERRSQGSLEATLEVLRTGEAMAAAVVTGEVNATLDGDASVTDLTVDAGLHAIGGRPTGLDARVALELSANAESYRLTVEMADGGRLVDVTSDFGPGARVIDGAWQVEVAPELVGAFARGRALPELSMASRGRARLDLASSRLEIDGAGHFEGRGWADVDPRLVEVDELIADVDVAATADPGRFEARRLRLALTGAGGRELLRLTAQQPLVVDLEGWGFTPESWGRPALRLEVDRFPLRWTRGFDPALVIEDGLVSAALDIVPVDERHTEIVTHEPFRALGLRFGAGGRGSQVPAVDVTVVPRVALDEGVLEAEIQRAQLTSSSGLDVRFSGGATTSPERWPVLELVGDIAVRVPALQRSISNLDAVRGDARFDLDLGAFALDLDRGSLDLTDTTGGAMMTVNFDNEVPLRIALPSFRADWSAAGSQQVKVRFDGFPITWASPFIPEIDLAGGTVFGELSAVTGGGRGLTLEPLGPFEVRDLQPVYRGRPFADGSTVSVEPHLRFDAAAARFAIENFRVRTALQGRLDGGLVLVAPRDGRRRISASLAIEGEFPSVTDRIGRLGALSWRQEAVIDLPTRRLEVTDLEVGLSDEVGTRILELTTIRPFTVGSEPFALQVDGGSPDVLLATITPLELQQLFPQIFGFRLEGVLPQGQFVGRAENGGLLLVADEPLLFRDVTVAWEDAALLDRVTIGLEYQILYSADGLQARSIEFSTLGPRGTPIADATLRAVMPLTDRTTFESLHFDTIANLEPLTRQPIFRGLPVFLEGTIGGTVDVSFGDRSTLEASLELRGARVENGGSLPDLDAAVDVVSVTNERLEVEAPVRLSSDLGVSDLGFAGTVVRQDDQLRFDATVGGDRIVVADLMELLHVVAPPDPEASRRDRGVAVASAAGERWSKTAIDQLRDRRDERPAWGDRVTGQASLDIGSVELARYSVDSVRGRLAVDPKRVELVGASATLLDAALTISGRVGFDGDRERPYDLELESRIDHIDLGRLFAAVDPEAPPTLEGIFEVRTSAFGRGNNLADLGLGALGSVSVSGRDGVFRGLAGQYRLARTGSKVLGFLTFSKQLKAISRLLGELEALEFDTFDLVLARENAHRFAISELTVVSPLARIEGGGGVEVETGVALAASPLDASFDMGTRGDMTILFEGLGLLAEGEDEHGYRPLARPVVVTGTVAEPDTSDFYEMLDAAARDSKGVVGVAMRRVNKKLQKGR